MNAGDHNDDFDARLKTRGRLIMPFDDDQLQPPAELDRIVVDQARRALRQYAAVPERVFPLHQWGLPLALAATLVLSFTLVLQLGGPSPTQVAQTATPATAEVTVDAAPAAAPPAAMQLESRLSGRVDAAEAVAPAPRRRAAPAAVADVGAVAKTMNEAPVQARAEAVYDSAAAPAVAAESAKMASPAAGAASRETRSDLAARDDPEAWFQHIQRLRVAGQAAAADRELALLHQRYPDYVIAREKLPKEP